MKPRFIIEVFGKGGERRLRPALHHAPQEFGRFFLRSTAVIGKFHQRRFRRRKCQYKNETDVFHCSVND
jgi:hypothetical protein